MTKKINKKHINVVLIVLGITAFVAYVGINNYYQKLLNSQPKTEAPLFSVGTETIYVSDFDFEKNAQPKVGNTDQESLIRTKLVNDSVILQAGEAQGYITLTPEIYNNAGKDYTQRIAAINKIKESYTQQQRTLEGTVVSVWFYNNNRVGTLGLTRSKQLALSKITEIYKKVQSKQITAQDAIKLLQQDTSLQQLDRAYKNNTGFNFSVHTTNGPTMDINSNEKLWSLNEGSLSDIMLIKDPTISGNGPKDAVYIFAQIDKKIDGNDLTFDQWLEVSKQKYEVKNNS